MPTYEYACPSCHEAFEMFQSMRDAPITVCPKCGREGVKRLIGRGAGIIFKGSGFYETDYKRPPAKKEGAEAGGSAAASGATTPAAAPATGSSSSSATSAPATSTPSKST